MENFNLPTNSSSSITDKLEYTIYQNNLNSQNLTNLQNSIIDYTKELLEPLNKISYIWSNEKFILNRCNIYENFLFRGKFNFGDNLSEEWLLVWLFNKLSLKFKELIITLRDTDGEFLLIELSEDLSSEYTPEFCENRLFLNNGKLHLLPSNLPKFPQLPANTNNFQDYELSSIIQDKYNQKLSEYPQSIQTNLHTSKLELPQNIAHLLAKNPQLISKITNSYYLREPSIIKQISLNTIKNQHYTPISVKFNKFNFSMVNYQSFGLIPKSILNRFDLSDQKKELATKIILGLELLLIELKLNSDSNNSERDIENYRFSTDKNWEIYYNSELETNYFKGLDESSEDYKLLLNKLKLNYLEELNNNDDDDNDNDNSISYKEIENILNEPIDNNIKFDSSIDDSEDWMEIGVNELDKLFNRKFTTNNTGEVEEGLELDDPDILRLDKINSNLNNYLNIESDFEGIENQNNLDLSEDLEVDDYFEKLEFYLNDLSTSEEIKDSEEDLLITKELEDRLTNVDLNSLEGASLEHLLSSVIEEQDQLGPSSILLKQLLNKE